MELSSSENITHGNHTEINVTGKYLKVSSLDFVDTLMS